MTTVFISSSSYSDGGGVLSELTPVRETLEDVFVDLVRAEEGVSVGAHS